MADAANGLRPESIAGFLGELEHLEAPLLSWGVVDGGLSEQEVAERARTFLDHAELPDVDEWDLIDELQRRGVLVEARFVRGIAYRTRMAETLRLAARLRQLFPKHLENGRWRRAPTLVADYRFTLRPRTYPRRCLTPDEVIQQVGRRMNLTNGRAAAMRALLHAPDRGPLRLSGFQARATEQLLADLEAVGSRGIIIGADTGSGKTLAFYLPALTHIAGLVDGIAWTKALAVYPRNELLKDQLAETFQEARRLDAVLQARADRKLTIGAFFGDTPHDAAALRRGQAWPRRQGGFVCPYFACPTPGCGAPLIWSEADLERGNEQLVCTRSGCGRRVGSDELAFTRRRMAASPPDVLFTSMEMLNRTMSDTRYGHVFGVGPRVRRPPQLLLLDEVHTYSGVSGAQSAMLLRRWRWKVGQPVRFVGLSATLREAQVFFAQLTDLRESEITSIEPWRDELENEGMEYLLALRSDPMSGAAVLATTIQAAMLFGRVLDRYQPGGGKSGGLYGSRVFVFTDDLDVTNRLFFDLRDAEGLDSFGRPAHRRDGSTGSLANLRNPALPERAQRDQAGQSWDLAVELGHQLTAGSHLLVGRTSSQDTGVDQDADVIVATASLEVGFDDSRVGTVVQHKTPHEVAQFLQRKGRAGRLRGMRPWTVVVLSDYGLDRATYQGYESLFDPELKPRYLPVSNRYVQRMHAVHAFMDWISDPLGRTVPGSTWRDFSRPHATEYERQRQRQQQATAIIEQVLRGGHLFDEFRRYLKGALRISDDVTDELLWQPPRSLMTGALPTLLRRLQTDWATAQPAGLRPGSDHVAQNAPLPDFVSPNLFSDLNLPEVKLVTPAQTAHGDDEERFEPVIAGMREFAPGRASRRYGYLHRYARHWTAPAVISGERAQDLNVHEFVEGQPIGTVRYEQDGRVVEVPCLRPWKLTAREVDRGIRDSSNAFLAWCTQIVPPPATGTLIDAPEPSTWAAFVEGIDFFTHATQREVTIRRFAIGSDATLHFEDGRTLETFFRFVDGRSPDQGEPTPVAIGVVLNVDALRLRFRPPAAFPTLAGMGDPADLRAFRTAYFAHRVEADPTLSELANRFQRRWLHQTFLSTLVLRAMERGRSLAAAHQQLLQDGLADALVGTLDLSFTVAELSDLPSDAEAGPDAAARTRVHQQLATLCHQPDAVAALSRLATVLWEQPGADWQEWARARFRVTLGNAVLLACQKLCSEFSPDELILDIDPGPPSGDTAAGDELWISETAVGGAGIVEELQRRIAADPRRFFRMVEHALRPSDFELVDTELERVLDRALNDQEVAQRFRDFRDAADHHERQVAFRQLIADLAHDGILVTHPVVAAISARLLRAGTSPATDKLIHALVRRWREEEQRLGVELDARVYAFVQSASTELDHALGEVATYVAGDRRQWRIDAIYSVLWPRGYQVRARTLGTYNPYAAMPPSDASLVLTQLGGQGMPVDIEAVDWFAKAHEALRRDGQVTLVATVARTRRLAEAIRRLAAEPVDLGYLHLYPRVVDLHRTSGQILAVLELKDAIQ